MHKFFQVSPSTEKLCEKTEGFIHTREDLDRWKRAQRDTVCSLEQEAGEGLLLGLHVSDREEGGSQL